MLPGKTAWNGPGGRGYWSLARAAPRRPLGGGARWRRAGRGVPAAKPLAPSLADARAIVELSEPTGTPFFSASSYRFHPDVPKLHEAAAKATRVQASSPFNKLAFPPDL